MWVPSFDRNNCILNCPTLCKWKEYKEIFFDNNKTKYQHGYGTAPQLRTKIHEHRWLYMVSEADCLDLPNVEQCTQPSLTYTEVGPEKIHRFYKCDHVRAVSLSTRKKEKDQNWFLHCEVLKYLLYYYKQIYLILKGIKTWTVWLPNQYRND